MSAPRAGETEGEIAIRTAVAVLRGVQRGLREKADNIDLVIADLESDLPEEPHHA